MNHSKWEAWKLEPGSVDAIITDPPYGRPYLPLYQTPAPSAAYLLKPGGSLLAMAGKSYLFEIGQLMTPHTASLLQSEWE